VDTPAAFEGFMMIAVWRVAMLIAAGLSCASAPADAREAKANQEALAGTISGEKIQKVGFRAMIQKQAIIDNLAGAARNNPDGTVSLSLQGDKDRINKVLDMIRAGNKKSSTGNSVNLAAAPLDPNLDTFTVFAWTSTSRNIINPYDLVFHLRPSDEAISKKEAAGVWNSIAESTLKGDDLAKFKKHLDSDD
jgi:acylphosphatase